MQTLLVLQKKVRSLQQRKRLQKRPPKTRERTKAAAKAAAEEPAGKKAKPDDSKDAGADGGEGNDDDLAGIFSEDEPDKDEDVDPLANVMET